MTQLSESSRNGRRRNSFFRGFISCHDYLIGNAVHLSAMCRSWTPARGDTSLLAQAMEPSQYTILSSPRRCSSPQAVTPPQQLPAARATTRAGAAPLRPPRLARQAALAAGSSGRGALALAGCTGAGCTGPSSGGRGGKATLGACRQWRGAALLRLDQHLVKPKSARSLDDVMDSLKFDGLEANVTLLSAHLGPLSLNPYFRYPVDTGLFFSGGFDNVFCMWDANTGIPEIRITLPVKVPGHPSLLKQSFRLLLLL